jgi:hypothetical protein
MLHMLSIDVPRGDGYANETNSITQCEQQERRIDNSLLLCSLLSRLLIATVPLLSSTLSVRTGRFSARYFSPSLSLIEQLRRTTDTRSLLRNPDKLPKEWITSHLRSLPALSGPHQVVKICSSVQNTDLLLLFNGTDCC